MKQKTLKGQEYREEILNRTYINQAFTRFNKKEGKMETIPMAFIFKEKIGEGEPEVITLKEFNMRYAMILILFGVL